MKLRKILIIDRDSNIAELLESCFKTEGYLTFATNSVDEALKHFDSTDVSIMVVDSLLPDDGTFTLLRSIRQKPEGRNVPIALVVSSRNKNVERDQSMQDMFRVPIVIKKPYRISTLLKTIDDFLKPAEAEISGRQQNLKGTEPPVASPIPEMMHSTITTEPDDYIELIGPNMLDEQFEEQPGEQVFPAPPPETMSTKQVEEPVEELTEIEKHHILLVDDEPMILNILNKILLDEGFEVSMTHKSTEAIKWAVQKKPDLVISDIMMPEIDGYSLCRVIKAKPELAQTKVVLLTAKNLTQDKGEGFKSGADFFMQKPINRQKLVSVIKSLLGLAD